MKKTFPIGLVGWAFLVVVASFLSWGAFKFVDKTIGYDGLSGYVGGPGPSSGWNPITGLPPTITVELTGWHGNLKLSGIVLPNWLAVAAALAAVTLGSMRAFGIGDVNLGVPMILTIYGIAHVTLLAFILFTSRGSVGIGSLLTLGALAGIFVSLFKVPGRQVVHKT